MRQRYNLGELEWTLAGWTPYVWRQQRSLEAGVSNNAEVPGVPAQVPGSVQRALRDAGLLPDWNVALNARECEWVENRHWIYTGRIPESWLQPGRTVRLRALGLDYCGWVLANGNEIATFTGSLMPHTFDLTPYLRAQGNTLQIVLGNPPRWLGQIGYTSEMQEWKPRFNYFWDWTSRLVQLGIWDDLILEVTDGDELVALTCASDADEAGGILHIDAEIAGDRGTDLQLTLERDGRTVRHEEVTAGEARAGIVWKGLPVELWWPNGEGDQALYTLRCSLLDAGGDTLDEQERRIGFKSVRWEPCAEAPPEADPWICTVNGRPSFLQGVNWTPILPNFADVTAEHYRRLLERYVELGCNTLRVWGGAVLEREVFYDLCDELGLLVWQEFPLSSSGLENRPPDSARAVEEMAEIAESYVRRRRHHVSLLLWCGGNELQTDRYRPVDETHPLIARMAEVVARHDPGRRFLPTSPSGPRFGGEEERFGQGLHWDVHGPWHVKGEIDGEWTRYWQNDDALFRSEVGVAGASPAEIIRRYKGDLDEVPGTTANPLWRRTAWWVEWTIFEREVGREPESLEEYVSWSQERQRRALSIAVAACKARFPRCGGILLWMGHDCFPCTANTAIIDFHGNFKPAAAAVGAIFRQQAPAVAQEGEPSHV